MCFVTIFVVVALFNVFSVSRYKLIDLLSARNKNERFKVRNPYVCLVGFIVSVVLLVWAYKSLIANGLVMLDDPLFMQATILMVVGTFLFFWSLAGFVLAVIMRIPQIYFKKLTPFTTRQIAGKINTAFISLSIICIMLFFALTVLSAGMGLANVFNGNVEKSTPFDATLTANISLAKGSLDNKEKMAQMYADDSEGAKAYEQKMLNHAQDVYTEAQKWDWDIKQRIMADFPTYSDVVDASAQMDIYQPHNTINLGEAMERFNIYLDVSHDDLPFGVVGVSQFNALRTLAGHPSVSVGEGEYAIANSLEMTNELAHAMAQKDEVMSVAGYNLKATGECIEQAFATMPLAGDPPNFIVSDSVIEKIRADKEVPSLSYLNIMYADSVEQGDAFIREVRDGFSNDDNSGYGEPWPITVGMTSSEVLDQALGMRMMLTYLALYVGFVLLITTSALLAVHQLSETSDSLGRYRMLAELGCDKKMIFRSLKQQVSLYFIAPLMLALAHVICALSVLNKNMFTALGTSLLPSVVISMMLLAVIYGTYLALTYFASRSLVKNALGKKLLG